MFPRIGVPQNGGFIMENPIKMDDLGVSLFSETSSWETSSWVLVLVFNDQKYIHQSPWKIEIGNEGFLTILCDAFAKVSLLV